MSVKNLNRLFDDGNIVKITEVTAEVDNNAQIPHIESVLSVDEIEDEASNGWFPINGLSGQDSYHGYLMHESEFISDNLFEKFKERPDYYTISYVPDEDEELRSWVILRHSFFS